MNKIEKANLVAIIIGLLGVVFGLYGLFTGSLFHEYFFSLFIGVSLAGTAYFNNVEWKKKNKGQK